MNQDGLLAPSELLSTVVHQQENIVTPNVQAETNKEQTNTKTQGGDLETRPQEAEVQENQEPEQEQLVEHENETQPAQQHQQVEEPRGLNQITGTVELEDGLQPQEERLQDYQEIEEHASP